MSQLFIVPQDHSRSQLRDGRFVLHGLDPNAVVEVPAYFLDPGASSARSPGSRDGRGPTDRSPSASSRAAPRGSGWSLPTASRSIGTTPGRWPRWSSPRGRRPCRAAKDGPLFSEEASVMSLDPINYGNDFQSDAQGRLTLPALIPGATYRILDVSPAFADGDPAIRKEFTIKSGETIDLGDILIARPQRRN